MPASRTLRSSRADTVPEPDASTPRAPGPVSSRLVGPHEVVATLGVSDTTEVLLAVTRGPHGFVRPVVIKRPCGARVDECVTRALAREALAYARVAHPSMVHLYDFVEHEGRPALVLEYVPGVTLGRLRAMLRRRREAIDDEVAMYVMAHVFGALAALHAARDPLTGEYLPIVHRDVTPGNVLLAWNGAAKLADLGIARLAGVESDSRVGLLKGTYGYMAPEQVTGGPITTRTDVYSACLLLRELLLGQRTFPRELPELELLQAMASPSLAPIERLRAGVPPRVREAVRAGLEPDPERRAITAAEVRDVLLGVVSMADAREQLRSVLAAVRRPDEPVTEEQTVRTNPLGPSTLLDMALGSRPSESERCGPPTSGVVRNERFVASDAPAALSTPSAFTAPPAAAPHAAPPAAPASPSAEARPVAGPDPRRGWPFELTLFAACVVGAVVALAIASLSARRGPAPRAPPVAAAAHAASSNPPLQPAPERRGDDRLAAGPPQAPRPAAAKSELYGELVVEPSRWSHRIYVDGHVDGTSGTRIRVRCGTHVARFGSQGRSQRIEVPCGGSVELRPKW